MDELSARLACHRLCLPNTRLAKALVHFGSANALLQSDTEALCQFFRKQDLEKIKHWRTNKSDIADDLSNDRQLLVELGVELIAITDDVYPPLLREIPDPPPLLYIQGNVSTLKNPQIAIVGSRKMTPQGGKLSHSFSSALAKAGLTITSGLALGIDSAAHRGALDAGASTIAVLGTGIDGRYPRSNRGLHDEIAASGGVLVSEYLIGTPPRGANFPKRNRIITGLSMATLVVEASEKSGSLVSARLAAEQGRQVFAIPGNLSSPASAGCHNLIREGAALVTAPKQIVEDLGAMLDVVLGTMITECSPTEDIGRAERQDEHWLLSALGQECLGLEALCDRCDQPAQDVAAAISHFELSGVISASAFGYQRVN